MAAAAEQQFPPQKQEEQPGKQHLMDPIPRALHPDYRQANKLHGKVALVIGGDSGIGRAVCYHFALEGATVAFTYVQGQEEKDAEDTLKKIQELKTPDAKDPIAFAADVGFDENCKMVVDGVVKKFGRIDILVNNAAEHALKHMKEGSTIINSTSVAAYCGSPMLLDYCATKGAIVSFTRALALQLVEKGIRVNAVAPGPVWTPLQVATMPEEAAAKVGAETPMGRAAQPHEIAPSYVFLASDESSSYFTGQVLHPNVVASFCLF
ncbi:hypothetical protein ACP275_07G028200 [Erythranthe tilingii]